MSNRPKIDEWEIRKAKEAAYRKRVAGQFWTDKDKAFDLDQGRFSIKPTTIMPVKGWHKYRR